MTEGKRHKIGLPLLKSRFVKDGVALISGNVWAQGIAFLAYILLARLFSPDDFGVYNIFFSYVEVLIIVSTCKYELGTVIAENDDEAATVSRLALRINALVSLVLLIAITAIVMIKYYRDPLGGTMSHYVIFLLLAPMVYFCGTSRVYASLFNRQRQFGHIALSEVVGSSIGVVFKILFGLPKLAATAWHTLGLPLGTVLGKVASNINYLAAMRKLRMPTTSSREAMRNAARKFRNFPLFTMPKDLVNSLSFNLPLLWLALYFDKAEVGLYALALTFTFRPVNIINNAIERLMYVRVAEKVRERRPIGRDIMWLTIWLNAVALPLFVVAFLFGDEIFGFLFGSRLHSCGYYLRCLLPWVYVTLTSSSLMFLANVFGRQRGEFVFHIVQFVLRVAAVIVGIVLLDFRVGILLFAIAGALVSIALMFWYLRMALRYDTSVV
jgi:O-antigen/teichoic acid export membrane protein